MDNGWVKLHRQIFENKLWLAEPFTKAQAWVDLFANACHKPNSFWVRGNEVKLQRGQVGWSEITMTKRWKWSRDKVRRFLVYLEGESNIRQQKTPITTVITILNYDKYQADDTTEKQQKNNRQDTNKKDKKVKNIVEQAPQDDIVKIIDSFKPVNGAFGRWYGNTTQRGAISRMIETHGLEQVLKVVAILPKTNTMPWITTITTPSQLEDKWSTLEAQLRKEKNKLSVKNKSTPNYVL
jgi:hypothetical protein